MRWVEGIVAASPIPRSSDESRIETGLRSHRLDHAFVRLRQQHHLGDKVSHDLLWATLVQTSNASVFHVMGDWNYDVPDRN